MTTVYAPNEILEIEIETPCLNLVVGSYNINQELPGKTRLEILAEELALFQVLVEPNQQQLKLATDQFETLKDEAVKKNKEINKVALAMGAPEQEVVAGALHGIKHSSSPQKLFRENVRRDPKPIYSLKVLGSKGLRLSDTEKTIKIAQDAASKAQAETIAAVIKLLKADDKGK